MDEEYYELLFHNQLDQFRFYVKKVSKGIKFGDLAMRMGNYDIGFENKLYN